jgi:hypothetical protein
MTRFSATKQADNLLAEGSEKAECRGEMPAGVGKPHNLAKLPTYGVILRHE